MFKILISLCFIAISVASPVNRVDVDHKGNFLIVKNIDEFKKAYPSLKLTPLKADITTFGKLHYTIGEKGADDKLLGNNADKQNWWSSPKDIQLMIRYPLIGKGEIVTFVDVEVNQSTDEGKIYIVDGGVGLEYIVFVVEAKQTTFLEYDAKIYGYQK